MKVKSVILLLFSSILLCSLVVGQEGTFGYWLAKGWDLHNKDPSSGAAIQYFENAIKLNNSSAEAWYGKGIAIEDKDDHDCTEAIKCFDTALEINPLYAEAWNNKGWCEAEPSMSDYDESMKCIDKAIAISQSYADAWNNKGITYVNDKRKDNTDLALNCFRKAIELDPNFGDAYENLCIILRDKGGELYTGEADNVCNKAKDLGYSTY